MSVNARDGMAPAAAGKYPTDLMRPAWAMAGVFAAVLMGAAIIGIAHRAAGSAGVQGGGIPMRVGSLTVHGPLKVRGELAVSGAILVHGPIQVRRVDRVPSNYPGFTSAGEKADARVVNGPMKLERGLIVDGDLRVDGPLKVDGEIKSSRELVADGPINEQSAL